jgi:hypothetical protein
MNARVATLGAGLLCLGVAAGLASVGSPDASKGEAASLGGLRTVLVDTWFLRAEALRREGRVDELPALYRRILEADPDSDTAIDYLADVEANDLRALAPTAAARIAWWDEADAFLSRALEKRPGSARLLFRKAQIRLDPPTRDADLAAELVRRKVDFRLDAFRFLADSIERAPSLGRGGRIHLVTFAQWAPGFAAERYAANGAGIDEILFRAKQLIRLRAADFADFTLDDAPDARSALDWLTGALSVVGAVRELLSLRPPNAVAARSILAKYAETVGRDGVVAALEPLVSK